MISPCVIHHRQIPLEHILIIVAGFLYIQIITINIQDSWPSRIRMIKERGISGDVARMGKKRKACRLLEGKRSLGKPNRR
jgi:hypothetical protein